MEVEAVLNCHWAWKQFTNFNSAGATAKRR